MTPPHGPALGARPASEPDEASAAAHVHDIFDSIAPSYDLLNHLLSFGLDRRWWRSAARAFAPTLARPEACILDLCCGTGDMTSALLALRPHDGRPVIGLDFSGAMLARARSKHARANAVWVEGDAMHMPYPDSTFDLVTAAFGFRNLTNYAGALTEIHRVLRPGGELGILECNHPEGIRGALYLLHAKYTLPIIGGWISGQREAYDYLPASIERFPRPPGMKQLLMEGGFTHIGWEGYFLHAAGLYRATKPPSVSSHP